MMDVKAHVRNLLQPTGKHSFTDLGAGRGGGGGAEA